jgi:hypothetical protein
MCLGKMKNTNSQDLTDLRFKPKEKTVPILIVKRVIPEIKAAPGCL